MPKNCMIKGDKKNEEVFNDASIGSIGGSYGV